MSVRVIAVGAELRAGDAGRVLVGERAAGYGLASGRGRTGIDWDDYERQRNMTVPEINQLAERVIDQDRLDIAVTFLQSHARRKAQIAWLLYKLMNGCRVDQANKG